MCRLELKGLEKIYGNKKQKKRVVKNLTISFEHGVYDFLAKMVQAKQH